MLGVFFLRRKQIIVITKGIIKDFKNKFLKFTFLLVFFISFFIIIISGLNANQNLNSYASNLLKNGGGSFFIMTLLMKLLMIAIVILVQNQNTCEMNTKIMSK